MVLLSEISKGELIRKAEILKVLGHPERLAILFLVYDKELCVKELMKELQISQPKVSQHVGLMKELGILSFHKEGTKVLYKLDNPEVREIIDTLLKFV
ncbi:regulatory protein ArsR [Desulfurobacterium thermolithotrophum DSM 11699]|uniref:Regulatory protein ArsR n=1 Tax=Desulfurobacterium thermolithotrophum (strain DSM 11699 / BSA) TaxID=868864 RepID=F0S2N4_DESTD|nr:metalloregulator ArsR/SmtB family transcription factor [Desulfurobacterium thermolithotrophum]ADY73106.1 regulatory protein ArsR [Desulfurobacterium thermolithotrophum DSM 11699]